MPSKAMYIESEAKYLIWKAGLGYSPSEQIKDQFENMVTFSISIAPDTEKDKVIDVAKFWRQRLEQACRSKTVVLFT